MRHWQKWLGWVIATVVADQISKLAWASSSGDFWLNTAGVGGWSLPVGVWEMLMPILLIVLCIWILRQKQLSNNEVIAWGLLIGGGTSNWLDRIWWGGVRDWLLLPGGWHNNVADYAISIGVGYLLWQWWRIQKTHEVDQQITKNGTT